MRITKASKCLKGVMPCTKPPLGASDIPERALSPAPPIREQRVTQSNVASCLSLQDGWEFTKRLHVVPAHTETHCFVGNSLWKCCCWLECDHSTGAQRKSKSLNYFLKARSYRL